MSRFLGEDWLLDVIPVSNDPGSGDEVVMRRGGELPPDVTSLAMARNLAKDRIDIPTLVPLDRLSSGQVILFAFAGPLIFRDQSADVVLIDEPEQHLHPSWQRLLIDALRELSPESQFIVATHSLEILDSVCSSERHLLLAEDDPRARDWQRPEPPHNGPPATQAPHDAQTAAQHLFTPDFWRDRARLLRDRYSEQDVLRRLVELGAHYEGALQGGGTWQECFSGKEILRHLRSHLPALDKVQGAPASSSQRDEDLAKRLSRIMRTGSSSTREGLRELRRALRGRARLRVE